MLQACSAVLSVAKTSPVSASTIFPSILSPLTSPETSGIVIESDSLAVSGSYRFASAGIVYFFSSEYFTVVPSAPIIRKVIFKCCSRFTIFCTTVRNSRSQLLALVIFFSLILYFSLSRSNVPVLLCGIEISGSAT